MLITIYDKAGNLKADLSPNDSSTQVKEVQGDSVLSLSFTHYEHIALDADDYADFLGERFWLTEKYRPRQNSGKEWVYDLKFYGVESMLKRLLVIKTVDNEEEPVFTLTAPPREHVAMIVKCMNVGMGNITDWKTGQVDGTENIVIDYFGKYCDEALREIAEKCGTEWWVDGQTVNVCRCEHGEPVELGYGKGLLSIDPGTADNVKFYTRLYPVGSSRNIDREKYGFTRLQLPGGRKYVEMNADKYGRVDHYEADAFADIYPRRTGTVSGVRSEVRTGEDGKPFTIYYFTDSTLPFDPNEYMIGGLVIRVSFQEGSELAGLGEEDDGTYFFEVNFNSTTREFEIITIWPYDNDMQLPGDKLVPKAGDKYILWNLRMPDEYYALAEEEFAAAVNKYNADHNLDISVYKAPTDHVWIEENDVDLSVGRRVRLESEEYFPGTGYRDSRITRITRRVNLPSQMDLEIGDAVGRTAMSRMSDSIESVRSYARTMAESVSLPDIIRTGDRTRATDNNLLSALRSYRDLLRKDRDDRSAHRIASDMGFEIGNYLAGVSGGMLGIDSTDGQSFADVFKLWVRGKAYFETLTIIEAETLGGRQYITPGGSVKCTKTEDVKDASGKVTAYRCYFLSEQDGEKTDTKIVTGDQAISEMFNARPGTANKVTNHRWWRLVTGVSNDAYTDDSGNHYGYIDLSVTDCETNSDIPKEGDVIAQFGNRTDRARQGAIMLDTVGADAPSIKLLAGINDYTLAGKDVITQGYDHVKGHSYMNVYGDTYIGDKEGNTYVKYDQDTKQVDIKAKLHIGTTVGDDTLEDYIKSVSPPVSQEDIEDFVNNIVDPKIAGMQNQIDGVIETWFFNGLPTLINYPALEWNTDAKKEAHLGDLYFDNDTGLAYRFSKDDQGAYYWNDKVDSATANALASAKKAQDTADGKRRVFTAEPTAQQEYDEGDLWVNATYGTQYSDDLLRCITHKDAGAPFNIAHWTKASKYTDDSALNQFLVDYEGTIDEIKGQLDGKAETWYQGTDPSVDWTDAATKALHKGDLWYCTADIAGTDFKKGTTWYWNGTAWERQDVPQSVFDAIDGKADIFVSKPTSYKENDLWFLEADYTLSGVFYKKGTLAVALRDMKPTGWDANDWTKKDRYTDDSALDAFKTSYQTTIDDIKGQLDGKAETWYQPTDPSTAARPNGWKGEPDAMHTGDLWYNTTDGTTWYWNGTAWKQQNVPADVFDAIDGKADIFVSKPTGGYRVNDLWFLEATYTLSDGTHPKGTLAVAVADMGSAWSGNDWAKKDRYTDDTLAQSALDRFDRWAADGVFSPTEMKELELELGRVNADKSKIDSQYGIYHDAQNPDAALDAAKSAYDSAYNAYRTAIDSVLNATPDKDGCVAVPTDFSPKMRQYYNVRAQYEYTLALKQKEHADSVVAPYEYLKNALAQDTVVQGGLVMSTLVSLGYTDSANKRHTLAGMNGQRSSKLGDRSIASWWGGEMLDLYNADGTKKATLTGKEATSLVRMDGTGYFVGGLFRINKTGLEIGDTVNGYGISMGMDGRLTLGNGIEINIGGEAKGLGEAIKSVDNLANTLSNLFTPFNGNTEETWKRIIEGKATYDNIRINAGAWTQSFLSAKGLNGDAGGSGAGKSYLSDLLDVSLGTLSSGQVLAWNGTKWANSALTLPDMAGYALQSWVTANYQPKGDYALSSALSSHTGNTTVHITADERTKWNKVVADLAAITGTDSDSVINKWEEVVAFLDTYTEADTLANLLSNKADKTQLGSYYTKTEADGRFVNATGDTITGYLYLGSKTAHVFASDTFGAWLQYGPNYINIKDGNPLVNNTHRIWHAGNDGSGSGLDADLLDGKHNGEVSAADATYLKDIASVSTSGTIKDGKDAFANIVKTMGNGVGYAVTLPGQVIDAWGIESATIAASHVYTALKISGAYLGSNYGTWLLTSYSNRNLGVVGRNNNAWTGVRWLAYTDDTVAAANKLATPRTIWGQSFDGTANVNGNMSGVGSITANGNIVTSAGISSSSIKIELDINNAVTGYGGEINRFGAPLYLQHRGANSTSPTGNLLMVCNGGNVGVGIASPSYKLDVNGFVMARSGIHIGTTADIGWYNISSRIAAGASTARGVNVGSLLVSNAWADSTKVPTNGIYSKGAVRIGECTISWDSANNMLKFDKGLYSDGAVSAKGANSSGGSGSGAGKSYLSDLLDVQLGTLANGQALIYRDGKWINAAFTTPDMTGYALQSWVLSNYVSALGTSGDYLTWTKNGTVNKITVPYATYAATVQGTYSGNGGKKLPNAYGRSRVGFFMSNQAVNGNSQYKDWILMDCYNGGDVGGGVAIGVNRQSLGAYIMRSEAARTEWAQSAELIGTHNYADILDGRYYTESEINAKLGSYLTSASALSTYVSALGVSGNYLTWTKNGTSNNITIPYATEASRFASSSLNNGDDLNNRITSGLFHTTTTTVCASLLNGPSGRTNGELWLDVRNVGTSGYGSQTLFTRGATNFEYWLRTFNISKQFSAWQQVLTDANYASVLDTRYYTETEINTKLNSYLTTASASSTYVKKSGDTMSGSLGILKTSANPYAYVKLGMADETNVMIHNAFIKNSRAAALSIYSAQTRKGDIGVNSTEPFYNDANNLYHKIWHDGNDGSGSGLDADLLDGNHATSFLRKVTVANNAVNDFNTFESMTLTGRGDPATGASLTNAPWTGAGPAGGYGVLTYLWSGYGIQMAFEYGANRVRIRNKYYSSGSGAVWNANWASIALLTDNVASATKLQTARTIWGQSFNGTANVSGNMTGVGSVSASGQFKTTATQGFLSETGTGVWSYMRLKSNSTLWDIAVKDTDLSGALQFRAQGAEANRVFIATNGHMSVGTTANSWCLNAGSFCCDSWVRTKGNTGWYNETYGGGWAMSDTTWVRIYNGKSVYVDTGQIRCDNQFNRMGYDGASWNNGYGAYNVAINDNSSQTPLMVAYRSGQTASVTGANRLLALELLNSGSELDFCFGGAWKFKMFSTGMFAASNSIRIGDCTISYDSSAGMLKFDKGIYSTGAVSAKGANSSGGSGSGGKNYLSELLDVNLGTMNASNAGQFLKWNGTRWVNAAITTPSMAGYALESWVTANYQPKGSYLNATGSNATAATLPNLVKKIAYNQDDFPYGSDYIIVCNSLDDYDACSKIEFSSVWMYVVDMMTKAGGYNIGTLASPLGAIYANGVSSGKGSTVFKLSCGGSANQLNLYSNGTVGIGASAQSTYRLDVNGTGRFTGNLACLKLTQTSDIRLKTNTKALELPLKSLADAPVFRFVWKKSGTCDYGTSAQYWKSVDDSLVDVTPEGTFGIDYGKIALAGLKTVAVKTLDHEERIAELERENEELKRQLKELQAA